MRDRAGRLFGRGVRRLGRGASRWSISTSALHALYVLPVLDPAEPGVIWTTIDNSVRERHALDAMRQKLADKNTRG